MQKKEEAVRIHKLLSEAGIMSRRKAEESIQNGKVTVNGRKALVGQKVNPARDVIVVDGVPASIRKNFIWRCTSHGDM